MFEQSRFVLDSLRVVQFQEEIAVEELRFRSAFFGFKRFRFPTPLTVMCEVENTVEEG